MGPAARGCTGLAAAILIAAPGHAGAAGLDLFYERTVMTLADARCGLFSAGVGAALAAAQAQARGAALRAGVEGRILAEVERRAQSKVLGTSCASPDLGLAASRVRHAFEGYAKLIRMDYPGDHAVWRADRSSSVKAARWRLAQDTHSLPRMVFGLAGWTGSNALMAVAQFPEAGAPYAARLVMRDPDQTSGPFLNAKGAALAEIPLARRMPSTGPQKTFPADARSVAGRDLLAADMTGGWAFRFPAEAARALAALDPREAVAVEFLFSNDQARRVYVEVGDFAAGRAFLQASGR